MCLEQRRRRTSYLPLTWIVIHRRCRNPKTEILENKFAILLLPPSPSPHPPPTRITFQNLWIWVWSAYRSYLWSMNSCKLCMNNAFVMTFSHNYGMELSFSSSHSSFCPCLPLRCCKFVVYICGISRGEAGRQIVRDWMEAVYLELEFTRVSCANLRKLNSFLWAFSLDHAQHVRDCE